MLLSGSKLGEALGISRQAVASARDAGKLVLTGKKYDTENSVNRAYISSTPQKMSAFKIFLKKFENGNVPTQKNTRKMNQQKESAAPELKPDQENVAQSNPSTISVTSDNPANMSLDDIMRSKSISDMLGSQQKTVKSMMENQVAMNKLAPRDSMGFCIERFINHIYTGITRVCSQTLTDISKDILAAGEVKNDFFKKFEDAGKQLVDDAKMKLKDDIIKSDL